MKMNRMIQRCKSLRGFLLIGSVLIFSPVGVVNAQPVESQAPSGQIAGEKLEPFAGAYKQVSEINNTYKQRIVEAGDPAKTEALQEEANQKMNQAVKDHGLTIEGYNEIFKAILNDEALKEEFMTVLNKTQ
ncbi:MAG: hypothetical protein NPIRA01_05600 [Nitrospirales bacterium]|nr:MAG: hypothetical protein NPIRA01_05600 [Nitrospirales bacterium]